VAALRCLDVDASLTQTHGHKHTPCFHLSTPACRSVNTVYTCPHVPALTHRYQTCSTYTCSTHPRTRHACMLACSPPPTCPRTQDGRYFVDRAVKYACERRVFGRAIGANQGVQHPIAKAHTAVEAARLMVYRAAELYDGGLPCGAEANMAKMLAADASWEAANTCFQTYGGCDTLSSNLFTRALPLFSFLVLSLPVIVSLSLSHVLSDLRGVRVIRCTSLIFLAHVRAHARDGHTRALTLTHARAHTYTQTHTHTRKRARVHTHTHTHNLLARVHRSNKPSCSRMHKRTRARTHTRTPHSHKVCVCARVRH
jgi:hypothetical protein